MVLIIDDMIMFVDFLPCNQYTIVKVKAFGNIVTFFETDKIALSLK